MTTPRSDGHQVPVMRACGHDMHVTWLMGATNLLAKAPGAWHGTLVSCPHRGRVETLDGLAALRDRGRIIDQGHQTEKTQLTNDVS